MRESTPFAGSGRLPSRALRLAHSARSDYLFSSKPNMTTIEGKNLKDLSHREERRFMVDHPRSAALYRAAQSSLLGGVPMNWMKKWAGAFPIFVKSAKGAHFTDVDNRDYVDLWVGEELKRRFGLPYWQFTLTATDANRFAIRIAREITQRPKILVFHYCYHGTVDESFASPDKNGAVGPRRGNIGPPVNPAETTRVVEFNDLNALEAALKHHDVACILAEPAMTNVGIILPDDGYWPAARELARRYGSLLIADETHTICAGPGGCTAAWKLDPDMVVFGKAIGSGIPGATFGVTEEVAQRISARIQLEDCDVGGIGGTLAGNALSLAAMRATLEHVLTPAAFEKMIPLAKRFTDGVAEHIRDANLPWNVQQLGARAEYTFAAKPPRNGDESAAAADFELERFLHLYALNRGVLLTPFHNMALMCPATTPADIDLHTKIFADAVHELT